MSRAPMVQLTRWIRDTPIPLFSLLISRHGKLVYELYTSSFERDDAHYLMSVTKSVVSQGLDAPDPPRDKSPEALARYHHFWTPSRLRFVLGEPLLGDWIEYRMVPSAAPKMKRRPFDRSSGARSAH